MSEISHGDSVEIFASSEKLSFVNYVQLFSSLSIKYLRQTADKLIILAVIYSVFSLLAYFLYLLIKTYVKDEQNVCMKRVLIVTAHPDDECMFFGPTIVNLRARNIPVHLLCLSPGDSVPNKRDVRKAELWQSCIALGLDGSLVELKKHTLLMDGHENEWSHKLVAKIILHNIEMLSIDTVITFDEMGVSEHPNHIALFNAMAYLTLNHLLPTDVCFFSLDSVNRLRKYSFMLDFLTSFFLSKICLISNLKQQYQVVKAMSCHKSQFVWFRKLYLVLSRYVSINTLKSWTQEELKYIVKYQEIVDGMKYKNKWYESLDDSLKKINSEHTLHTITRTDNFEADENAQDDEDDADVSFIAKIPESIVPSMEPRTCDLSTTSPVYESPSSSPMEFRRFPRKSPSPDPSTLAANESIHNGEIYVRKSRFLIPKTYGSFYNSSSSETSDDKDDGEAVSAGSNASLSVSKIEDGIGAKTPPCSDQLSNGNSSEDLVNSSETVRDWTNIAEVSDARLLCSGQDVEPCDGDQVHLSYEIEDIESVLDVDEDLEKEQTDLQVEVRGRLKNADDVTGNGLINVDAMYNDDVRAKEQIHKTEDYDDAFDLSAKLVDSGRKLSYQKHVLDEKSIMEMNKSEDLEEIGEQRDVINSNIDDDAIDIFSNNLQSTSGEHKTLAQLAEPESCVENVQQTKAQTLEPVQEEINVREVKNNKVRSTKEVSNIQELRPASNVESSNSSEQESTIDELTFDNGNAANNLNKRNKKKRRNRKNKRGNQEDDFTPNKRLESKVHDEQVAPCVEFGNTREHSNKLSSCEHSNNPSSCEHSIKASSYEHNGGKEADEASKLSAENNQNVFNMEILCSEMGNTIVEDDSSVIMQSVSTN